MLSWCCGMVENVVIYVSVLTFRRSPIKAHFSTWMEDTAADKLCGQVCRIAVLFGHYGVSQTIAAVFLAPLIRCCLRKVRTSNECHYTKYQKQSHHKHPLSIISILIGCST